MFALRDHKTKIERDRFGYFTGFDKQGNPSAMVKLDLQVKSSITHDGPRVPTARSTRAGVLQSHASGVDVLGGR